LYAKFFTKLAAKCCTILEAGCFKQKNWPLALTQQGLTALKIENVRLLLGWYGPGNGQTPPQTVMQMVRITDCP